MSNYFWDGEWHITMFLLVYIDDIIVASSSKGALALLKHLGVEFALKDLLDRYITSWA
jgi:hypothetical protein